MTWGYIKHREGYEHRLIAEQALGRPLPEGAEVHHMGDSRDNENLVICNSRAHHMWIHYRMRAYAACGNPRYVKCEYCKEYDDPDSPDMYTARRARSGFRARHRSCHAKAMRR